MSYTAYIMGVFPALSETFIYREIAGLRERGMSIRTFSVHRPDPRSIHAEAAPLARDTVYLRPAGLRVAAAALGGAFLRRPGTFLGTLGSLMRGRHRHPLRGRVRTLFHFAEGALLARNLREEPGARHIHAHYVSGPATIAFTASRLAGIPFSFTAHADDIILDADLLPEKLWAARFAVTCSGFGRQALLERAGAWQSGKVSMLHHGIDTRRFAGEPPRAAAPFTFLHVGRLSEEKAQHLLVEACALLSREGLDFRCLLVGDGPLAEALSGLVRDLGLEGRVTLEGRALQEDIPAYYRRADAFVLSSIRENLPNVLVESLASAVPVITPRLGGIEELVEDGVNGYIVEPGSARALSDAMRRMMGSGEERGRMGQAGRELVRRSFDRDRCTEELMRLFSRHGLAPARSGRLQAAVGDG
jgi:colanic acid/amylovoran biosynthesis glycosyltransferase